MKRFLSKKWHLPIWMLAVILAVMLVAGGAFAAVNVFQGSVTVMVSEAISWSYVGGDGSWDGATNTWSVDMFPSESKSATFRFYNASSGAITITPLVIGPTPAAPGLTCSFAAASYLVSGGGSVDAVLTAQADQSVTPGVYTFTITFSR